MFLCFPLIFTRELYDVTTVYHIGQNRTEKFVDIHLRTNALGLPVRSEGTNIETKEKDFHLDINEWKLDNWNTIENKSALLKANNEILSDSQTLLLEFRTYQCYPIYLLLSQYKFSATYKKKFYYIIFNRPDCSYVDILQCSNVNSEGTIGNIRERIYGHDFSCDRKRRLNVYNYNSYSYYSFLWYIKQNNGKIQIWGDGITSENNMLFDWVDESPNKINFKVIHGGANVTAYPFVQLLTAVGEATMTSTWFHPKYKNMCLVIVFHTEEYLQYPLRIYTEDSSLNKFLLGYIGDDSKVGWQTGRIITAWPESIKSKEVRVIIETFQPGKKIIIQEVTSCNGEDEEDVIVIPVHTLEQIPVFPYDDEFDSKLTLMTHANLYFRESVTAFDIAVNDTGSSRKSYGIDCLNGGISVENKCACPAGFIGDQCEQGCGQNSFGMDCGGECSTNSSECSGLLLCTPFVGCLCPPGYRGDTCETKCRHWKYGADCRQSCGHCVGACDIYTGTCSACSPGYVLPFCKQKYAYTSIPPRVEATKFGEVSVLPNLSNIEGVNVKLYEIQYQKADNISPRLRWIKHSTLPFKQTNEITEESVITGLEHGVLYNVRIILIGRDLNSYENSDVPFATFLSLCTIPDKCDYNMNTASTETSFTVSWSYLNTTVYWCPPTFYEVSWKEGWKWISHNITENTITIVDKLPGKKFRFKVRAMTTNGFAPFSPTIQLSTVNSAPPASSVRNLSVISTDSESAKLNWIHPALSKYINLTYVVTYQCMKRVACETGCMESVGEIRVYSTSVILNSLLPFSQYFVTVSPEGGLKQPIYFGTEMGVPTEVVLSSRTPEATNTSVTVYWEKVEVCSGLFYKYMYQLFKPDNILKVLQNGKTTKTNVTFNNLSVSTDYMVRIFVQTTENINSKNYLEINASTLATVPDRVQNLTVYKQGRHFLGIRWGPPKMTYGPLESFTITHELDDVTKSENIKPVPCVVWPHLYCHTITSLKADKRYIINVSARNTLVHADGFLANVTAITKEKTPGPPENIQLVNVTSTSVAIQWDYPYLANGVIRAFLLNVEETEQFEEDKCCELYPMVEITVTEELKHYVAEVSGLHPASTYVLSVSAKTIAFGPSQTLTVHTRPPSLPMANPPNVMVNTSDTWSWLPQQNQQFLNNSDLYTALIKWHLLLVITNDTVFTNTGIHNNNLNDELQTVVPGNFYVSAEYTDDKTDVVIATGEVRETIWGEINNSPLQPLHTYQLAAVQLTEYCGVYNADIILSTAFEAA